MFSGPCRTVVPMTENTPGAAGNVPEHQQQSPEGTASNPAEVPPEAPPEQHGGQESSPWSAAGYQTYRPAGQAEYPSVPAAQLPGTETPAAYPQSGGYPSLGAPDPAQQPPG